MISTANLRLRLPISTTYPQKLRSPERAKSVRNTPPIAICRSRNPLAKRSRDRFKRRARIERKIFVRPLGPAHRPVKVGYRKRGPNRSGENRVAKQRPRHADKERLQIVGHHYGFKFGRIDCPRDKCIANPHEIEIIARSADDDEREVWVCHPEGAGNFSNQPMLLSTASRRENSQAVDNASALSSPRCVVRCCVWPLHQGDLALGKEPCRKRPRLLARNKNSVSRLDDFAPATPVDFSGP